MDTRHTENTDSRSVRAAVLLATAMTAYLPATPVHAKRLAVLEFKGEDLEPKSLAYLGRRVRGEALKHLPAGWEVMTRDNMLVLIDTAQGQCVKEGECDVETGRHIGADLVVSGEVVRFGGQIRLTMNSYDTASGRLVRSAEAAGPDERQLGESLLAACRSLFAPAEPAAASTRSFAEASTAPPTPPAAELPSPAMTGTEAAAATGRPAVEKPPRMARSEAPHPDDGSDAGPTAELTVSAGYELFEATENLENAPYLGVRAAFHLTRALSTEFSVGFVPTQMEEEVRTQKEGAWQMEQNPVTTTSIEADLSYEFGAASLRPFLAAGLGLKVNSEPDFNNGVGQTDMDPMLGLAVGAKVDLSVRFRLRLDLRYKCAFDRAPYKTAAIANDGDDGLTFSNSFSNLIVTAGLSLVL